MSFLNSVQKSYKRALKRKYREVRGVIKAHARNGDNHMSIFCIEKNEEQAIIEPLKKEGFEIEEDYAKHFVIKW